MTLDPLLVQAVYEAVDQIPLGKVVSYGQLARLIGRPKNARLVGRILGHSGKIGQHPCHRVVNAAGRLVPGWEDQGHLLWAEGVTFKENGCVDMKQHQWEA